MLNKAQKKYTVGGILSGGRFLKIAAGALLCVTAALVVLACRNIENALTNNLSAKKEITKFKLAEVNGEINAGSRTIVVVLPEEQPLVNLKADVKHTGESISPAPEKEQDYSGDVVFTVTAQDGSKAEYTVTIQRAGSSAKEITDFAFPGITSVKTVIDNAAGVINITLPREVEQTIFTPVVSHTGAAYEPAGPQNFSSSVTYKVTAADGSKKMYRTAVAREKSDENSIQMFTLLGNEGYIDGTDIRIDLPYGTLAANVTPDLISHNGAGIEPDADTPLDFSDDVTYIVTSEKGTKKTYTVQVYIAANDAAEIQVFRLEGALGRITGSDIEVTVPYETDLRENLVPEISHNGASISPPAGSAQNFSGPVQYSVLAEDGITTNSYTVSVRQAASPYKNITSFELPYSGGRAEGHITNSTAAAQNGNITGSTITVVVPNGTNLMSLLPQIEISELASVSPTTAQNFENDVMYTVTADDGTYQQYTVTVMAADPNSKSIINFKLPGQLNVAPMIEHGEDADAAGEITVLMPQGANLTALTPTITHSGRTIEGANLPKNFSDPNNTVVYRVEAGNGSTKSYRVKITTPVLPPILAQDNPSGYTVQCSGDLYSDGKNGFSQSTNFYYSLDNNVNTYVAFHSKGKITLTWESGAVQVNRIRVLSSGAMNPVIEFRTSANAWTTAATYAGSGGEFIQPLPQTMSITGVRISVTNYLSQRPRIRELILELVE